MGCYIQRRPMQLGQAPALDGVQVKYRTGSVKHSISTCTSYPVPAEEAREDAGAEQILFHVYKYKVSLHKGSKERWELKLVVQKRATIGKFHRLYYVPEIGCGRYHMTSYKLAAQCWCTRRAITASKLSPRLRREDVTLF